MAKHDMSSSSCLKNDVFISFRGEDVRFNFLSHLRSALDRDNIKSYADDRDLRKGQVVWPSLCRAIHESQLAIVVFSQNYADSTWCLKELVEILNCRKTQGLVVIPVFYQVDPSHVRKYSGTYGEAIAKHETYFGDEHNESIKAWKAALTEAANMSGWDSRSRDFKNESEVTEKIVEDVAEKLSLRFPVELKVQQLVDIEKKCEEVKRLLSRNQKIGIWGMGGIGKTTIAKAMFSQLFPQYDSVCFLANVREESKRIGLICLCDKLLSELLKEGHHKYNFAGYEYNLKRLGNKKVLIVLDDVECSDQLDGLCRQWDNAGPKSKLIITTRNKHLLSGRVDEIYEVKQLDACGFYAIGGIKVLEDKALITISYSGTIQMHDLIEEMGLNIVRGGSEDPGKHSRLSGIEEVSDVLENEKGSDVVEGIKLDLSSIQDLHLNASTFNMMTNLRILRLYVPLGKKSGNVHHSGVLGKLSGKLRYLEWNGFRLKSLPVNFCAKMLVEIRMPHSHVTELWQGVQDVANLVRIDLAECKYLKKLPDLSKASKLKWVNLSGCESLCDIHPTVFSFDTLETLILDGCKKVKSLVSKKHLAALKYIGVNGCTSLREFSVSSDSMTRLDLSSTRIEMLDSSIGRLTNLWSLILHGLRRGNLPNELSSLNYLMELRICSCRVVIDKENLHVLFDGLTSLRLLHLKDCCNLCELPDNIENLSKLYELRLDGSCLKTLPATIEYLEKLEILSIENCRKLENLPQLPPSVAELRAVNCRSLRTVSNLSYLTNTKFISLMNCVGLDEPSVHCIMRRADLATRNVALNTFSTMYYTVFPGVTKHIFLKFCFPGNRVPGQFQHRTRGSSITIDLPSSKTGFEGLTLCAVLSPACVWRMNKVGAKIWCQCYLPDGTRLGPVTTWYHEPVTALCSDHVFIWYDPSHFNSILKINDVVEQSDKRVSFEFFVTNDTGEHVKSISIRECGVTVNLLQSHSFNWECGSDHDEITMEIDTSDESDCSDINNHESNFSQHGATTMETETSDVSHCNDINNHESNFSQHGALTMETETSDEGNCNDINNHESNFSQHYCSHHCLFDVVRYLWRLISRSIAIPRERGKVEEKLL